MWGNPYTYKKKPGMLPGFESLHYEIVLWGLRNGLMPRVIDMSTKVHVWRCGFGRSINFKWGVGAHS